MSVKIIFTILHLFGVAIGAGGAFFSDWIFLHAIKDRRLSKDEHDILRAAGVAIWAGIILLYISGIGLVLQDPAYYLSSEKFLMKAGIVGIITINGIVLHDRHLPVIASFIDHPRLEQKDIRQHAPRVLLGGAISVVSWSFAIVLGALRSLPVSLPLMLTLYICSIGIGWCVGMVLTHRFSREH